MCNESKSIVSESNNRKKSWSEPVGLRYAWHSLYYFIMAVAVLQIETLFCTIYPWSPLRASYSADTVAEDQQRLYAWEKIWKYAYSASCTQQSPQVSSTQVSAVVGFVTHICLRSRINIVTWAVKLFMFTFKMHSWQTQQHLLWVHFQTFNAVSQSSRAEEACGGDGPQALHWLNSLLFLGPYSI